MSRKRTLTTLLGIILLGLSAGASGSPKAVFERTAVVPEKKGEEPSGPDEIDREIEKYFDGIRNSANIDLDEKRLNELFRKGNDPARAVPENRGRVSFPNRNVGPQTKSSGEPSRGGIASHTVQAGDTIYALSKKYGVPPAVILRHNPMLAKRPMYIGEEILVTQIDSKKPVRRSSTVYHSVKKGDNLTRLARRYRVSVASLRQWNGIKGNAIQIGQRLKVGNRTRVSIPKGYVERALFQMPADGRITSSFGRRRNPFDGSFSSFHNGVDIGLNLGAPFVAAREGVVIFAQRMGGYGNCIFIRHSDGYVSVYAHGKKMMVRRGDVVQRGQLIGYVGRTGNATGPHLHFEVRRWKKAMNPMTAIKLREVVPKSVNQIQKAALR